MHFLCLQEFSVLLCLGMELSRLLSYGAWVFHLYTRSASSLFALVQIFLCPNLLSMWLVGQWFGDATSARKRKEREEKYEGTFSARN